MCLGAPWTHCQFERPLHAFDCTLRCCPLSPLSLTTPLRPTLRWLCLAAVRSSVGLHGLPHDLSASLLSYAKASGLSGGIPADMGAAVQQVRNGG